MSPRTQRSANRTANCAGPQWDRRDAIGGERSRARTWERHSARSPESEMTRWLQMRCCVVILDMTALQPAISSSALNVTCSDVPQSPTEYIEHESDSKRARAVSNNNATQAMPGEESHLRIAVERAIIERHGVVKAVARSVPVVHVQAQRRFIDDVDDLRWRAHIFLEETQCIGNLTSRDDVLELLVKSLIRHLTHQQEPQRQRK